MVYGLREEQAREETSAQLEAKIRDVIRTKLGVTRKRINVNKDILEPETFVQAIIYCLLHS